MSSPTRLAVIGLGRMGAFHARHVQELARERGDCELVAIADCNAETRSRVLEDLRAGQDGSIRTFAAAGEVAAAGVADAAIIASGTDSHDTDARALIEAGMRVLLEKPLTHSLKSGRELVDYLEADARRRRAVMLAFMRRFDAAWQFVKESIDAGRIGRPFKMVTVLEDNVPPPAGYDSPGIFVDMGVHLADEAMWVLEARPCALSGFGSRVYAHSVSNINEDYDDAFLQLWFDGDRVAQLAVSRNHIAGYRNEVWVYGDGGMVHGGAFSKDQTRVVVEAISPTGLIERKVFAQRDYGPDVPFFIGRFGLAYKREVDYFVERVRTGEWFSVDHRNGLNAMEVVVAGTGALASGEDVVAVEYGS